MTTLADTPTLLTARQLAELLGVSAETVLRWTRRGDLPAIRLPGGAVRYRPAALEAWLSAHENLGPDGPEKGDGPADGRPVREITTPQGGVHHEHRHKDGSVRGC